MTEDPDDRLASELRGLALGYADAADARDVAAFLSVFHPDAVVAVYRPEQPDLPASTFTGHGELAAIPQRLGRYTATRHEVGAARYTRVASGAVAGEVACVAHHFTATGAGSADRVMEISYVDRYRCDEGRWTIARREVRIARERVVGT